jgi:hypothetical protein
VQNDVNAYCAVVQERREVPGDGRRYGQRVWLATFDSMTWKMPRLLGKAGDHLYQVAMSIDYILNYVATATQAGLLELPEDVLPATAMLSETEPVVAELRNVVVERWDVPGEKKYMRHRRLRELVHGLKAERVEAHEEIVETEATGTDELL